MSLVAWAYEVSERNLENALPRRWSHVKGVARQARSVIAAVGEDAELLEASAILHDVGYAPHLAVTGFHPLDGARYLAGVGAPERLVALIAHHSCAIKEAELRGIRDQLVAFPDELGAVRDALWHCDVTTTPDGDSTTVRDRIAEIKARYGPGHLVTAFIASAESELVSASERTLERLARASHGQPM